MREMGWSPIRASTSRRCFGITPIKFGRAVGMGCCGEGKDGQQRAARPITAEERASLRQELTGIYLAIARDPKQHPALRMQAANHLLERLENSYRDVIV